MLDIGFALNAILPMIIIIAVGYVLKQIGIINEEIARGLNRLVFVLLIPVFMFYSIYNMEAFHIDWNLSVFLIVMILMLYVIGWLVAKFFIVDHQSKAVIIQSAIRSNASSVGVPVVLAIALSGLRAEANVIAMTGLTVAIYNTLGVITFQIYDKDTHHIQIFPEIGRA